MTHLTLTRRHVIVGGLAAATMLPGARFARAATPQPGGTLRISHSTRIATLNVLNGASDENHGPILIGLQH